MLFTATIAVAILAANVASVSIENANEYLERVLATKFVEEARYSRIDPYNFPDIHVDLFSKRITDNEANLSNGKLHNLSKVRRLGNCSQPIWTFANISFTCNLGFDELIVNYTANVTYDNMKMVFYPTTSMTNVSVTIQITTTPQENIPNMKIFRVNSTVKVKVTSKMISIGDVTEDIIPPIEDRIVSSCKTNLHRVLMGRFKDVMGYSIYKTPFPMPSV